MTPNADPPTTTFTSPTESSGLLVTTRTRNSYSPCRTSKDGVSPGVSVPKSASSPRSEAASSSGETKVPDRSPWNVATFASTAASLLTRTRSGVSSYRM